MFFDNTQVWVFITLFITYQCFWFKALTVTFFFKFLDKFNLRSHQSFERLETVPKRVYGFDISGYIGDGESPGNTSGQYEPTLSGSDKSKEELEETEHTAGRLIRYCLVGFLSEQFRCLTCLRGAV